MTSQGMLVVKLLVARSSAFLPIIFDEIDTGISGEVAVYVGEVMADLVVHMHVIAISQLPQIASKGLAYIKVYKGNLGKKAQSNIKLLA